MLSLAEIEHNILRAKSVRPKLLWAIMPKGFGFFFVVVVINVGCWVLL